LSYDFISPNLSTTRSYGWRLRPESSSIFLLDTTLTNTDSIKVELADPGYYLMTLQSQLRRIYNGETYTCLDSTTNRYFVKPEVIPNIVTPNTTIGANDVFKLPPGKIEIFNRWGKRIFEAETSSRNLDSYWDVAQIPSGTYFYVYQSNRTGDVQKGWVKIIR
jgi:gliding motility-associated-like protein